MLLAGCTVNPQDLAQPPQNSSKGLTNASSQANISSQPSALLTLEEVAKHNTKQDCWMVISNKVLDLSSFTTHSGGDIYAPYCGSDATQAFNDKGGTGKNHSGYAFTLLDSYVIGEIGKPMPSRNSSSGNVSTPSGTIGGNNTTLPANNNTLPGNITQNASTSIILTMEEVAKHNTANDCWMVIYGKVLDLTSFASHPGGSTYVPFCGTEATQAFDTKGGRGNTHSSSAIADLAAYTVGALGQPQNRTVEAGNITIARGDDDGKWGDD